MSRLAEVRQSRSDANSGTGAITAIWAISALISVIEFDPYQGTSPRKSLDFKRTALMDCFANSTVKEGKQDDWKNR